MKPVNLTNLTKLISQLTTVKDAQQITAYISQLMRPDETAQFIDSITHVSEAEQKNIARILIDTYPTSLAYQTKIIPIGQVRFVLPRNQANTLTTIDYATLNQLADSDHVQYLPQNPVYLELEPYDDHHHQILIEQDN